VTSIQTVTAGNNTQRILDTKLCTGTLLRPVSAKMVTAKRQGGSVMRRQTVPGLVSAGTETVLAQVTCVNMSVIQTRTVKIFTAIQL